MDAPITAVSWLERERYNPVQADPKEGVLI
jgi:hypothetical protein